MIIYLCNQLLLSPLSFSTFLIIITTIRSFGTAEGAQAGCIFCIIQDTIQSTIQGRKEQYNYDTENITKNNTKHNKKKNTKHNTKYSKKKNTKLAA